MIKRIFSIFFAIFLITSFAGASYMIASPLPTTNPTPILDDKFSMALHVVFRHEGKFSDHKNDKGGATKYGVSLRFLKAAGIDIDLDGDIDIYDLLAINKEDAKYIYKSFWWDKYQYEAINSVPVATKILDLSINMGALQAHKIVQLAANKLGYKLLIDGILGEKSLYAINALSKLYQDDFIKNINNEAKQFYYSLVEKNPELSVFLHGWLNRVNDPLP